MHLVMGEAQQHQFLPALEEQRAMQLAFELLGLSNGESNLLGETASSASDSGGDSDKPRRSQNTTECVPVPSSEHVAEIVGRQGCKIKALRAKTNTYIKTPVRGEEAFFVVTGRKEDVEAAKREILSAADHFTQIRASRRHSQGGQPAPGQVTAYVRVPYKVVGLVVGPKGATIKRIQQLTHTYIITPSREKEPIFEVTGLPENVEIARQEIEAHIASRTGSVSSESDENGDFRYGSSNASYEGLATFTNNYFNMSSAANAPSMQSFGAFTMPNTTQAQNNWLTPTTPTTPIASQFNSMQPSNNYASVFGSVDHWTSSFQPQQQQQKPNGFLNGNGLSPFYHSSASTYAPSLLKAPATPTPILNISNDHDEGISVSGGSPGASYDPLINGFVPPFLSSIWSELDDPKSEPPRRSSLGSNSSGSAEMFNSGDYLWHQPARRISSAPLVAAVTKPLSVGAIGDGYYLRGEVH